MYVSLISKLVYIICSRSAIDYCQYNIRFLSHNYLSKLIQLVIFLYNQPIITVVL